MRAPEMTENTDRVRDKAQAVSEKDTGHAADCSPPQGSFIFSRRDE